MEYEDVLFRPENRMKNQSDSDLDLLIGLLFAFAEHVKPHFSHRPCLQDPGDELVLEAAVAGNADIVPSTSATSHPPIASA